jgi:hypothetical protein
MRLAASRRLGIPRLRTDFSVFAARYREQVRPVTKLPDVVHE